MSPTMNTRDFTVLAASTLSWAATSAMVRASGVATSRAPASRSPPGAGTPRASSTFAAYPQAAHKATSSSPAAEGAMNSWDPDPPIMPGSESTTT